MLLNISGYTGKLQFVHRQKPGTASRSLALLDSKKKERKKKEGEKVGLATNKIHMGNLAREADKTTTEF